MPHGGPDWGTAGPVEAIFTLEDMGELAARLGAINVYDRRGNVAYLDDFEGPVLKMDVDPENPTDYARLDSTNVKSGSQAVRVHTDNLADGSVILSHGMPILGSKRLGYEISFSKIPIRLDFYMFTYFHTGLKTYYAGVKLDTWLKKLYLYVPPGVYKEVADSGHLSEANFLFHTWKLVIDFNTLKYVRLLFNHYEHPVPTIALKVVDDVEVTPRIHTELQLLNQDAIGGDVWLDNFIITQNEP